MLTPHVKQIGTLPTAHPRAAGEPQGHVAQSLVTKATDEQQPDPAPQAPVQH
jgi:hypothetical protein